MATVFDTAGYILNKKGPMSSLKLQKLCYYCQAWHYTWTGKPIFAERFEAWKSGPVCPELYEVHKHQYLVNPDDINGKPDNLTDDEIESIDVVLDEYGDMQPYELRERTHQESPWIDARTDVLPGENSDHVISLEDMGRYYAEGSG